MSVEMKNRIMKAAEELFLEKGYRGTTIKMIVKKAKTSVGNCYFYFKNKEDILVELTQYVFDNKMNIRDHFKMEQLNLIQRMALLSYVTSYHMLIDQAGTLIGILGSGFKEIRQYQMEKFHQVVERYFTEDEITQISCEQSDGCPQLQYIFKATHGSLTNIAESFIKDELSGSLEEVALFMSRWQIQAIGFTKDEVAEALNYVNSRQDEIHTYLQSTLEQ